MKSNRFLWISLLIACVWYGLISLVNHYCFRTYSLDLGAYTNALYDYAHFQWNDSLAFKSQPENLLADHFDLYLPIIAPLTYIFGTYTLLVVQLVAILFGALGCYRLLMLWYPERPFYAKSGLVYFLCFFGVFSALAFDYHSSVVASMLVPWLFLKLEQRKFKWVILLFVLILMAKENMALWMLFVALGLVWKYWKDQQIRLFCMGLFGVALLYFFAVVNWWMPAFSNSGKFENFKYSLLGNSTGEAFKFILTHPLDAFKLLFTNTHGNTLYDYVKIELWIFILINGFLLVRRPYYLLMLVPIIGQKMFNDNPTMWGVTHHYSIEFAPIITLGIFDVIRTFKSSTVGRIMAIVMLVIGIGTSFHVMDNTIAYAEKARIRVYKSAHYNREFSVAEANKVLALIPKNAVVSAQSAFVPHLALRDKIYTFPEIKNAEYIIISPIENPFPINQDLFNAKKDSLIQNKNWIEIYSSNDLILFRLKK